MPRLIWVFAGRTATLLVLSRGGSYSHQYHFSTTLTSVYFSTEQVDDLPTIIKFPTYSSFSASWQFKMFANYWISWYALINSRTVLITLVIHLKQCTIGCSHHLSCDVSALMTVIEPQHDKTYQQNRMCAQRRLRSAWASKKACVLSYQLSAKWRLRQCGCPGWSESSLGAQAILLVLSCSCSINWILTQVQVSSRNFRQISYDRLTYSHLVVTTADICNWTGWTVHVWVQIFP